MIRLYVLLHLAFNYTNVCLFLFLIVLYDDSMFLYSYIDMTLTCSIYHGPLWRLMQIKWTWMNEWMNEFVVALLHHKDTHRPFSSTNMPLSYRFSVLFSSRRKFQSPTHVESGLVWSKMKPQTLCCSPGFGYLYTGLQSVLLRFYTFWPSETYNRQYPLT